MRNYTEQLLRIVPFFYKLQRNIITSRHFSSRRCFSLCRSISAIISFSINLFASSTLLATSISISSLRFSNSSSTRFLTSNSILLAASSSTTYTRIKQIIIQKPQQFFQSQPKITNKPFVPLLWAVSVVPYQLVYRLHPCAYGECEVVEFFDAVNENGHRLTPHY